MSDAEGDQTEPQTSRAVSLAAEMESLATQARRILDASRKREKFDLSTPSGWTGLFESTTSKRLSDQLPQESLIQLRMLSLQWHMLHRKLRFEATTRPVWNT